MEKTKRIRRTQEEKEKFVADFKASGIKKVKDFIKQTGAPYNLYSWIKKYDKKENVTTEIKE